MDEKVTEETKRHTVLRSTIREILKKHFRHFYDVFFGIFKERETKLNHSRNKLHPYNNNTSF